MGLKNKEGSGITRERRVACAASSRFGVRASGARLPTLPGDRAKYSSSTIRALHTTTFANKYKSTSIALGGGGKWKSRAALSIYERKEETPSHFSLSDLLLRADWLGLLFAVQFEDVFGARSRVQGGVRSGVGILPSSTRVYLTEYLVNWSLEEMVSLCSDGNTRDSYVAKVNMVLWFKQRISLGSICKIFCRSSQKCENPAAVDFACFEEVSEPDSLISMGHLKAVRQLLQN